MAVDNNIESGTRLITNSESLRQKLMTRNLYAPDTQYPDKPTDTQKIVNTISDIINVVQPFKTFNLKDSLIGRSIVNPTPLTEIGLVMLGKQFALNSASHLSQQTLPDINLSPRNILRGGKVFKKRIDYQITKKSDQSGFENFLDKVIFRNIQDTSPFTSTLNSEYIKNTGTGQLEFLYSAINRNLYKNNDQTFYEYATIADCKIEDRRTYVANRNYFGGSDPITGLNYNPYKLDQSTTVSNDLANFAMRTAFEKTAETNAKQTYAPNKDFIDENFGRTHNPAVGEPISEVENAWVSKYDEFNNQSNIDTNLIWGRNGISGEANDKIGNLRGTFADANQIPNVNQDVPNTDYNIQSGLLEYTRNLLNASNGSIIDQTKKIFVEGSNQDKYVHGFNGSALWVANNSKYAQENKSAGKTGMRQHSVLDKYDRFAKAIRFNGNNVYGGNPNSVIFNNVLPRIHPTIDQQTGEVNNKNMMLSIENLAVKVMKEPTGKYGIIDDEYGSPIPIDEAGPFNGRIMWFPPYNMELVETASAKYDSTVMIGRNEPMYNYQNSERTATLSFTLLIDYPPHVRNYGDQRSISEFFAFGGDEYENKFVPLEQLQATLTDIETKIVNITGEQNLNIPTQVLKPRPVRIAFPNDEPKEGQESGYIDRLYGVHTYEIIGGCPSRPDKTSSGFNQDIFFVTGLTEAGEGKYDASSLPLAGFSQYSINTNDFVDQFKHVPLLDQLLHYVYDDEENRSLYDINIVGGASKLYQVPARQAAYNYALGMRRAKVAEDFIKARIRVLFGDSAENLHIKINLSSKGSSEAKPENGTVDAIGYPETKLERYAIVTFDKNSTPQKAKTRKLNTTETQLVTKLQQDADAIKSKIEKAKRMNMNIYNMRGSGGANETQDSGILGGFKSMVGNYYYPVFHSQTPEDFHKRLTFLQQCTRQGAAIRYGDVTDKEYRARNSVFGRQPICILRVGDFFYTKVIIESVTVDYNDTTWDMNPEGFGMQPMLARVTLQMKVMGGQSLSGPIDALQNAVSFNYYANSTFTNAGMYNLPSKVAKSQESYINGILTNEQKEFLKKYNK